MTNPTPHGQVPEALRLADLLLNLQTHMGPRRPSHPDDAHCWDGYTQSSAELRRLHAENEALRAAHVQNPAEIEHVAGDVSKNGAELNVSTQQPVAQQGAADGFFLLLPQRPKPEAPAGTAGLDWDAYSGAQMLAFGRDCSDAAIAALRTQQPAPATQQAGEPAFWMNEKGHTWSHSDWKQFPKHRAKYPIPLYAHRPPPLPAPDCHHRPPCDECAALAAQGGE